MSANKIRKINGRKVYNKNATPRKKYELPNGQIFRIYSGHTRPVRKLEGDDDGHNSPPRIRAAATKARHTERRKWERVYSNDNHYDPNRFARTPDLA